MQEVSMSELVTELGDPNLRPLGKYQPYVKHVSEDRRRYILRFDNGYGLLVEFPNRSTIIAWRPDAKSVHDFYDVEGTIMFEHFEGICDLVSKYGPAPAF